MENHQTSNLTNGTKVKLLCSYGGRILPRPTGSRHLSYVGGDTKMFAVDRRAKFSDIAAKLHPICGGSEISVKYQLPGEDLDALVSLINDDDVDHMMAEYDRARRSSASPARLRLFLFVKDRGPAPNPNPDYLFGFDKEYQPSIGPAPVAVNGGRDQSGAYVYGLVPFRGYGNREPPVYGVGSVPEQKMMVGVKVNQRN